MKLDQIRIRNEHLRTPGSCHGFGTMATFSSPETEDLSHMWLSEGVVQLSITLGVVLYKRLQLT